MEKRKAKWVDVGCVTGKLRIFLTKIEGAEYPFVCVEGGDEEKYLNGDVFNTNNWSSIKEIKEPRYRPYIFEYDAELYLGLKCTNLNSKFIIAHVSCQSDLDRLFKEVKTLDGKPVGKLIE